ncbi:hypothetical protein GJ496_008160 [Pomphorhynchus laevis]|nr:hypothetical protein GJ496_008160 [Pomphorhynchus laevis]
MDGPFLWTKDHQGFLLTAFFWGYIISQIPGALIGTIYGPKYTVLFAILISGICAACYKVAAFVSIKLIWFLRVIVGLCTGMILPCASQLWTNWAPVQERSFLISFAVSGSHLGSVVTLPIGGILCVKGLDGGWPTLFYLIASACGIWCVAWFFLFSDNPSKHPFISSKEKNYILKNTNISKSKISIKQVPWKAILLNRALHANIICHTFLHWGLYTLLTSIPNYFKDVLHLDIKSNGGLSAIPYLCMWFFTTVSGIMSDFLIHKNCISRTWARKLSNLTGSIPVAICLILLTKVKKDQITLAIALLAISQGFYGVAFGSGYMVIPNDIAGQYAGIAFGISNTFGTIPGLISPYLTGFMTRNKSQKEWTNVFIVSAVMYIIAGVVFTIFGTSELQDFARSTEDTRNLDELEPMAKLPNT